MTRQPANGSPRFVYSTAASLDGYVTDPAGSLDWLTTTAHDPHGPGGWTDLDARTGAIAMGRTTYDWVAAELERTGQPWPHTQPTWVLTTRPARAVAPGITFTHAPVTEVAEQMRAAAGSRDCWIAGGGQTAAVFADAGLIDEVLVTIAPVILGGGTPLLTTTLPLTLHSATVNGQLAVLRYTTRST